MGIFIFDEEVIELMTLVLGDEISEFIKLATRAVKSEYYRNRKIADRWMNQFEEFCLEHELEVSLGDLLA